MRIIHMDRDIIVCIKPSGLLSTDEPGGLPELLRRELGEGEDIRTVHRLDRVVSGLMALARNHAAASELSRQIREGGFEKEYLAIVHGETPPSGELRDLMYRDRARKMSFVTDTPGKGVLEARLGFETLGWDAERELSLVRVQLYTGRTHQIRCQFAHHGFPLLGERKYSLSDEPWPLALWSYRLSFKHPGNGQMQVFSEKPPNEAPWNLFKFNN